MQTPTAALARPARLNGEQIETLLRASIPSAKLTFRHDDERGRAVLVVEGSKGKMEAKATLKSASRDHVLELAAQLKKALG